MDQNSDRAWQSFSPEAVSSPLNLAGAIADGQLDFLSVYDAEDLLWSCEAQDGPPSKRQCIPSDWFEEAALAFFSSEEPNPNPAAPLQPLPEQQPPFVPPTNSLFPPLPPPSTVEATMAAAALEPRNHASLQTLDVARNAASGAETPAVTAIWPQPVQEPVLAAATPAAPASAAFPSPPAAASPALPLTPLDPSDTLAPAAASTAYSTIPQATSVPHPVTTSPYPLVSPPAVGAVPSAASSALGPPRAAPRSTLAQRLAQALQAHTSRSGNKGGHASQNGERAGGRRKAALKSAALVQPETTAAAAAVDARAAAGAAAAGDAAAAGAGSGASAAAASAVWGAAMGSAAEAGGQATAAAPGWTEAGAKTGSGGPHADQQGGMLAARAAAAVAAASVAASAAATAAVSARAEMAASAGGGAAQTAAGAQGRDAEEERSRPGGVETGPRERGPATAWLARALPEEEETAAVSPVVEGGDEWAEAVWGSKVGRETARESPLIVDGMEVAGQVGERGSQRAEPLSAVSKAGLGPSRHSSSFYEGPFGLGQEEGGRNATQELPAPKWGGQGALLHLAASEDSNSSGYHPIQAKRGRREAKEGNASEGQVSLSSAAAESHGSGGRGAEGSEERGGAAEVEGPMNRQWPCSSPCVLRSAEGMSVRERVLEAAHAVATGEPTAGSLLSSLSASFSPLGPPMHRLAHFICQALRVRHFGPLNDGAAGASAGMDALLPVQVLKQCIARIIPKLAHPAFLSAASNHLFLSAISGRERRLHFLDLNLWVCSQWHDLFRVLGKFPNPPAVRISKLEVPRSQSSIDDLYSSPAYRQSLFRAAHENNVRLSFTLVPLPIENITREFLNHLHEAVEKGGAHYKASAESSSISSSPPHPQLRVVSAPRAKWRSQQKRFERGAEEEEDEEVFFVNAALRFHTLSDGSVVRHSPRDAALGVVRALKPRLLVLGEKNMAMNDPFFLRRVASVFDSYLPLFECVEASVPSNNDPERLTFERSLLGREVTNVVALEGLQRYTRPETVACWNERMTRAGFVQCKLPQPNLRNMALTLLRHFPVYYGVQEEKGAMVLTWKDSHLLAVSTWRLAN